QLRLRDSSVGSTIINVPAALRTSIDPRWEDDVVYGSEPLRARFGRKDRIGRTIEHAIGARGIGDDDAGGIVQREIAFALDCIDRVKDRVPSALDAYGRRACAVFEFSPRTPNGEKRCVFGGAANIFKVSLDGVYRYICDTRDLPAL